jgi:hypothetical protein
MRGDLQYVGPNFKHNRGEGFDVKGKWKKCSVRR